MRWPWWLYKLNDPLDRWGAEDKWAHFFGGWAAMCYTRSWLAVVCLVLLVELLELERWYGWQERGAPQPWPFLCDHVSLKDIGWGLLGAWMATW